MASHKHRLLIYRLGSLGDTIVALPALHLIARTFPDTERWLLTNFSVSTKAAPMAEVLDGTGLIDGYLEYPIGLRDPRALLRLWQEIRKLKPDMLIYLAEPRGYIKALRDATFFRACGIWRIIGIPYTLDCKRSKKLGANLYEYEGNRLVRCLQELGNTHLDGDMIFDLNLSTAERESAHMAIEPLNQNWPMIAVSVGAKCDVKEWEDENWSVLLAKLSESLPGWGLVMLGATVEHRRSEALMAYWKGISINLSGQLTVRESAAVLERARFFIGHDSGPMHLAAAVGTPCVAIFSSQEIPGKWFPYGKGHRVLYQPMPCQGCRLEVCIKYDKACIRSVTVEQVKNYALTLVA